MNILDFNETNIITLTNSITAKEVYIREFRYKKTYSQLTDLFENLKHTVNANFSTLPTELKTFSTKVSTILDGL